MTSSTDTTVRHHVVVDLPVERAFRLFVEQFDQVKPHEHNLLSSPIVETVFEARVGGAVFDRGEDGTICRWARVLEFDPPHGFVISWDISPAWKIETDPDRCSEVEFTFTEQGAEQTRLEVEHRHLDRHLDGWEHERDAVAGQGGWPLYLVNFRRVAQA